MGAIFKNFDESKLIRSLHLVGAYLFM